ncbi:flagellar M-ring protein FliF [Xanthomonas campestris pv. phormiicola]|nr:flagellar M-ring protein FliF [Xanthomonas campestris pv. phormiicola]UYC17877.1 flagellar M-ring protein FliF [Xanthomonas campestris pv. phormiicola]
MIVKLKQAAARWVPALAKLPAAAVSPRALPLVVLALALTGAVMMYLQHDDARYKPLYGVQEKILTADAMAALDAGGIAYRLHPDTGQILVPESKLGTARMLLAAKGVVGKTPPGLEVVDHDDPLGVSQFVQDVRFRRGLEGELAQSIQSLEAVSSARVHLAVAKSSSFILSDGDKSSASVVLGLKPGRHLDRQQVAAIIALVAGSVANLTSERVSVIDQSGNLLSAMVDPTAPIGSDQSEAAGRIREQTLHNIRDLLAPSLGDGNFRASVAVEMDQDRVEETHEQFGDAPHVTQEATREENDSGTMPLGVPGSLSNRAVPTATNQQAGAAGGGANGGSNGPGSKRNALTRQYAYDRNVVQIKRNPQRIKRLNVAVVLNNAAAPALAGAKSGQPWQPAQLANIENILRSGIGIDAKRNDTLVVSALRFQPNANPLPPPWWRDPENLVLALPYLGYALLAILGFFLVLRPLLKMLRQWVEATTQAGGPLLAASGAEPVSLLPVAAPAQPKVLAISETLLPPVGSEVDVLIDHLKILATQAPERVAEVIRPWIQKNG